jgi:hypothetical protein
MRFSRLPREAAAIVILRRRFGYSINTLASWLGRSTSFVQRILEFNRLTAHASHDLRKLPQRIRRLTAARLRDEIIYYGRAWEAWILGEGEKPP